MSRILLTCGPWLAEAAGDLGGNLVRLEYSGRPLLRTPSQAPDPYLFGSPMLFNLLAIPILLYPSWTNQ